MADVTTLLASAIQKSNEVIDLVKGQFKKWDNDVKNKISWADWEIKNKVSWADAQVNNLISSVHSSVIFKVEGDSDKFYPVIVTTSYQPFSFTISRDNVHWDGDEYGRCLIQINGFTSHWGHGANFTRIVTNMYNKKEFLARAYEENETGWIVLYLRGNTTYRFINNFGTATLHDYSIKAKRFKYNEENWIEFREVGDGADTTYMNALKNWWPMRLDVGCVIGSRGENGRIIDTQHQ